MAFAVFSLIIFAVDIAIGGIMSNNISSLKRNGIKKVALISQLMDSEDPKEEAIIILKELSHEN